MPDKESQSLKAFKKVAAEEISRADRSYDFKSYREEMAHQERMEKIKQEGRQNTLLIVSFSSVIVILIFFWLLPQ